MCLIAPWCVQAYSALFGVANTSKQHEGTLCIGDVRSAMAKVCWVYAEGGHEQMVSACLTMQVILRLTELLRTHVVIPNF